MAMKKAVASEEKLLKLIRRKNNPAHSDKADQGPGGGDGKKAQKPKKGPKRDLLEFANAALLLVLIGAFLYAGSRYWAGSSDEAAAPVRASGRSRKATAETDILLDKGKPFRHYQQSLERRDIFKSPWEKTKINKGALKEHGADILKHLKIVGILLDDDNPRAIIEDAKEKQTYFVSEDENIGNILVQSIHEDRVILFHDDKLMELVP